MFFVLYVCCLQYFSFYEEFSKILQIYVRFHESTHVTRQILMTLKFFRQIFEKSSNVKINLNIFSNKLDIHGSVHHDVLNENDQQDGNCVG